MWTCAWYPAAASAALRSSTLSVSSGARSTAARIAGAASSRKAGSMGSTCRISNRASMRRSSSLKALPHGAAGTVGLLDGVGHFVAKGQAMQSGAQFADRRGRQRHVADRLRAGRAPHLQLGGPVLAVEDPGVIDFREIVIFGGQPEDRDGRNAVLGEPFGQPRGMERFVNGVGRTGKETHLLAGHHRYGARLGQPRQRLALQGFAPVAPRPAPRAVHPEDRDLARRRLVRFQVAQWMAIEGGGAVRMIEHVRKKGEVCGSSVWRTQVQCMDVDQLTR